ncbi:hypothetical protein QR685DRAFT_505948, partial [Neurospora intermedia]
MAILGSSKVPGPIEFISGNKGSWIRCPDGSWSGMAMATSSLRDPVSQSENVSLENIIVHRPVHLMGGVSLHIVAQGSGH